MCKEGYTLCFLCPYCIIGYMNQISEYEGPTEEDVRLYEAHMNRIKLRIDEARGLLYKKSSDERDLLYAVLQLRIAIEETACASLIANRVSFEDAEKAFRLKRFEEVQKALKLLNPSYWPKAVKESAPEPNTEAVASFEPVEGSLTDTEWMKIWGKLSSMLHMRNPWLPERDIKRNHQFAKTVVDKLVTTLNAHVTELVGGQHFVMAQVYASPVRAYGFSLVHNSDT